MVTTPKVEFLFDFGSPNAYLCHLVIPDIEKRQQKIARERGFEIAEHALYLYAECTKVRCPHRKP